MKLSATLLAVCAIALATTSSAQSALKPDLAAIRFLLGHWDNGRGRLAESGGTSKGSTIITAEASGTAILSRAHTDVFDAQGKAVKSFEQLLLIYAEAGTLRAHYSDDQHVIHYTSASVEPGKSVTFTSAAGSGPVFSLRYEWKPPRTLAITFAMTPPGQTLLQPIATGTLKKRQ